MAIAQGRDAVGAITSDARLRADAKIEIVDEAYDDGEHALFREIIARDVFVRPPPERAELCTEADDLFVLESLATSRERGMIDALHAPALVYADGLHAAVRARRNSHLAPSGRDDQSFNSFERRLVCDAPARRILVPEAASLRAAPSPPMGAPPAPDTRQRICRHLLLNFCLRACHPCPSCAKKTCARMLPRAGCEIMTGEMWGRNRGRVKGYKII